MTSHLSIIIPVLNEEERLPAAVQMLGPFLEGLADQVEVLVVDNGSRDATARIGQELAARDARFRFLHTDKAGKGLAVRLGMNAARGDYRLFCDVDFSMPVKEIGLITQALDRGADIAIGSREVRGSRRIGEPTMRHLMGRVFNFAVQILVVRGIADTQCGFKGFRASAAEDLFRRQQINGWAFDVEVLALAQRSGYRIVEVPITWVYDAASRVNPVIDTFRMIRELLMIRRNLRRERYRQIPDADNRSTP